MPHAESPNPPSSPPVDDTIMSEAVPGALNEEPESQSETPRLTPAPAVKEADQTNVEDIFDDMDDDDDNEFSSSAPITTQESSQPQP